MRMNLAMVAAVAVAAVVAAMWISREEQTVHEATAPPPSASPAGHRGAWSTPTLDSSKHVELEAGHELTAEPPPKLAPSPRSLGFEADAPRHTNTAMTEAEQLESLAEELHQIRAEALAAGASSTVEEALSAHGDRVDGMVASLAESQ